MRSDPLSRRAVGACLFAAFFAGAARGDEPEAVDVRTFGAVGDGLTDDTAALTRAHQSGRALIYPKTEGYFRINQPLEVQTDILGRGGEIRLTGNGNHNHEILRVKRNTRPVTISGLVLDGEYEGGTAGEWSHAISCTAANHVTIRNNVIRRPYGDCVYVGSDETLAPCRDILIAGNTLIDPRRCNVAVVSGERIRISNNKIHSKGGEGSAIDLEPDKNGADRLHDVSIIGNVFDAPQYCIVVSAGFHEKTTNVVIRGNSAKGRWFVWFSPTANAQGGTVEGNRFTATRPDGYFLRNDGDPSLVVSNNIDGSSCGTPGYRSLAAGKALGKRFNSNVFCQ